MTIVRFSSNGSLLVLFAATVIMTISHLTLIVLAAFDDGSCACELQSRPDIAAKALTARWMVHSLDWGVLSTISTRLGDGHASPIPFGNIYSFVDGPCDNSTGTIYLYGTYLDQSFLDTADNPIVSFTLSEASLSSVCAGRDGLDSCTLGTKYGDPENPVCARLTITGELIVLDGGVPEYAFAKDALFERHATMKGWPTNHDWVIAKIGHLRDIWLIDFFGGAAIIDPKDYFDASFTVTVDEEKEEENV